MITYNNIAAFSQPLSTTFQPVNEPREGQIEHSYLDHDDTLAEARLARTLAPSP